MLLLTAHKIKLGNVRDKSKKEDLFVQSILTKANFFFQDFIFYRNKKHRAVYHGHIQQEHKNYKLKDLLFSHFPLLGADVQNCGDEERCEMMLK